MCFKEEVLEPKLFYSKGGGWASLFKSYSSAAKSKYRVFLYNELSQSGSGTCMSQDHSRFSIIIDASYQLLTIFQKSQHSFPAWVTKNKTKQNFSGPLEKPEQGLGCGLNVKTTAELPWVLDNFTYCCPVQTIHCPGCPGQGDRRPSWA